MKEIKEIRAEFEKLNTSFLEISTKYKQIKADLPSDNKDMEDMMYNMMDNIDRRISYIWDAIYSLDNALYNHASKGHLPKLDGSQMKKALNKLGLEDSFDVVVPTVYAKARRQGTIFEINLPIKK